MDLSVVDFMARWIVLGTAFLLLTALFRKQVKLEDTTGYLLCLCLLIPFNIVLAGSSKELPDIIANSQIGIAGMIVAANILLIYMLTEILPALSVSSKGAMIIFAIVFSTAAFGVSFIPEMPDFFSSEQRW